MSVDALRNKTLHRGERKLPRCSKCGLVRVLDPCRDCATPAQLADYPPAPKPRP